MDEKTRTSGMNEGSCRGENEQIENVPESSKLCSSETGATSSAKSKKKKAKKKSKPKRDTAVPISRLDNELPLPQGVKSHYFDPVKGKGLVATQHFNAGETVFTEDAFVAAPPSHALSAVEKGELCTQCFLPVSSSPLSVSCSAAPCSARFCNRLCESRARTSHHVLLCVGQNPSIKPFQQFLSQHKWLSLSSLARSYARIMLCWSNSPPQSLLHSENQNKTSSKPATVEETRSHLDAMATVSELERRARNPGWDVERNAFLSAMGEAHRLLRLGLDPYDDSRVAASKENRRLPGKWPLKENFPKAIAADLFSWQCFLNALGRANLNMEAQGGLYCVHSHLNHSCDPNISIRHPPNRNGIRQATRVSAVAIRSIEPGEELVITYQDPSVPQVRRSLLLWREHMFGPCSCPRCEKELALLSPEQRRERDTAYATGRQSQLEANDDNQDNQHHNFDKIPRDVQYNQEQNSQANSNASETGKDLSGLEDEVRAALGF